MSRAGAEPAVEMAGVSKAFRGHLGIGRTVAVDDLGLEVRRGEIFGLLGPNGAGKTTTIKLLLALLRPDRGAVRVLGRPPSDTAVRARIGFLPERPYFYDYLTAEEFLDFYGRLHGLPDRDGKARIGRILDRVGLGGCERTPLRRFSKGMVQRLGLAQALQHDPDLLILDEPMSGLDPIGRRDVRDMILALREAGRTVLFSSHILQDAEMICDRVAILRRGRVAAVGSLDEMVSQRVAWYEVSLRAPLPDPLPGELLSRDRDHCLLRVRDVRELGRLLVGVDQVGGEVTSIWPRRETLEDLFLREVGEAPRVHENVG
jgi:ABC-2 type transport system ATP-binding protein